MCRDFLDFGCHKMEKLDSMIFKIFLNYKLCNLFLNCTSDTLFYCERKIRFNFQPRAFQKHELFGFWIVIPLYSDHLTLRKELVTFLLTLKSHISLVFENKQYNLSMYKLSTACCGPS